MSKNLKEAKSAEESKVDERGSWGGNLITVNISCKRDSFGNTVILTGFTDLFELIHPQRLKGMVVD